MQNTTGRLLLITAISILAKGELANETVNYDTKAKTYVMKQSPRGVLWNSVLRNFTKFTGKYLAWPATLLKKRLLHRRSPVSFVKFLRTLFLTEHLWWLHLYVPIWARSVSYLKRAVVVKLEQGFRSSRSEIILKTGALKNFGKTSLLDTLFDKVAILKTIKKKLQYRCFPVGFAKLLRTPFFYGTDSVAASDV